MTLDSSFWVGTLNARGRSSRLLDMARAGEIRIDISEPIATETIRVLREEFGWDGYRLNDAYQKLSRLSHIVEPKQTLNVIAEDPPDNRILECAAEARSDYIVTWDKDLLRLGQYGRAKILRVTDFLREMEPGRVR